MNSNISHEELNNISTDYSPAEEKNILKTFSPKQELIMVYVGYPWRKKDEGACKVEDDKSWKNFLQPLLNFYVKNFNKNYEKKGIRAGLSRLRGSHAQDVLGAIVSKIKEADILVFDVIDEAGNVNANVMFEIGIALGLGKSCFIFSRKSRDGKCLNLPSDLCGYFYTAYSHNYDNKTENKIKELISNKNKQKKENEKINKKLKYYAINRLDDKMGFITRYVQLLNKIGREKLSK